MKLLSQRQEEILMFLIDYQSKKGFPPTAREISQHMGVYHKAARDHLKALERKGYIRLHPGKSRGVEVIASHPLSPNAIPVLGRIPAGNPIFALENLDETIELDPSFFSSGKCFGLRVHGDSMIDAHIADGDYVVIKQQDYAENGSIAAVLMGEEVTLKYYFKRQDRIELQPANPKVMPLIFTSDSEEIRILGVMVGLIRKQF